MRWLACLVALLALGPAPVAAALPKPPPGRAASSDALAELTVRPIGSPSGYDRDKFGSSWASAGDGCDVSDRVLIRDGRDVQVGEDCRLIGRWRSIYDGKTFTDSSKLDIDHVVPLRNAWRSGARSWSVERRKRFANDLDGQELVAVSAKSNRSKGDQAPDEWKPPRRKAWCLYARWWVAVKSTWHLRVTSEEKGALGSMLDTC
jgi:hypothetical protein